MHIDRDGTRLAYDEAGTGAAALLIHGWGVNRMALQPQFEFLSATHRVVAVDLRGFGESSAPEQRYTVEGYAEDLDEFVGRLDLSRITVIGHSMGGLVALALAARRPERIARTVVLEAPVTPSEATIAPLRGIVEGLRGDDYRTFAGRVLTHLAGPDFDSSELERMIEVAASTPRHVLLSSFEEMLTFDSRAAAAKVQSPILYVGTDTARYADEDEFRRLCPQLVVERISGCGHYFPCERPEALHAVLSRFLGTRHSEP